MIQCARRRRASECQVLRVLEGPERANRRAVRATHVMRRADMRRSSGFRPIVTYLYVRAWGERGHHPRDSAALSSASMMTPLRRRLSMIERIQRW